MVHHGALTIAAVAMASVLLAAHIPAMAAIPNYYTSREMHGFNTRGNQAAIQEIKTTLTNKADVVWAKSYIMEMVTTYDRFTDQVAGAGWVHMRLPSDLIQSTSAVYYYNGVFAGLVFYGDLSGSSFIAKTDRGSFNSGSNCWNWVRTVGPYSDTKCLVDFDLGYGEVWTTSASEFNTFGTVTEYAGLQYRPSAGGSWTNWSSGGGSFYCWDSSPFKTLTGANVNSWNVIPPGSGTGCTGNNFSINHPLP